jgi:ribonucleotide monophosphatase NagD (HAD superfamily)
MTDNEIIKALECCSSNTVDDCCNCPGLDDVYDDLSTEECMCGLMKLALDLINRQKAEKEALIAGQETLQKHIAEQNAEIERLKKALVVVDIMEEQHKYALNKAKAEAIKECLQEVRKRTSSYICAARIRLVTDEIEKEMVGDV